MERKRANKRLDLKYLEESIKLMVNYRAKKLKTELFEIELDESAFIQKIDDDMLKRVIKESKISEVDKDLLYASAF